MGALMMIGKSRGRNSMQALRPKRV